MRDTNRRQQALSICLVLLTVLSVVAAGTTSGAAATPNAPPETLEQQALQQTTGDVLHRANAGGGFTTGEGEQWDTLVDYMVAGEDETSSHGQPSSIDSSVPADTPDQIWEAERWDPDGGEEMQYEFAVPDGQQVEVRLYFYDGYSGTGSPGDRVFDVAIEDQTVLDDFDIVDTYGDDTAAMESFTVTSDGTIDVDFGHEVENPQVNAIEIVAAESSPGELGASPSTVDYGTVVVNDSQTETVKLTNLGNASNSSHPDVTVTDASVSGTDTSDFTADFSGNVTLAPEESTTVNVTYAPSAAQAHAATLEVSHTGTNSPVTVDLTGAGASSVPVGFSKSALQGFSAGSPTAIDFGPDGRAYVSTQDGTVYALEVERAGEDSYQVVNQAQVDAIKDIPNHDDFGNLDTGENNRQITGLTAGGNAAQPVVYVSSSDPEIDVGQDDDDTDTNSGAISRLTFDWNDDGSLATVDHDVMALGLPRSEENHATNGLDLTDDEGTLYVAQGGHTNKGAPGDNFGHTPEYALSAAVLAIDLDQVTSNYSPTSLQSENSNYPDLDYYYSLPTVQGGDLPFGGNDGLNQAKMVPGGPVQVYSPGYRNPYDLVLSADDQLYVIDNGPNGGWGGQPADSSGNTVESGCTNHPNEDGSYGTGDQLHLATEGSYGGHAAPIRANPDGAGLYDADGNQYFDFNASNTPVPFDEANPVECDYQDPTEDNSIGPTFGWTGGITEYTASNFDGDMQGDLLVVENSNTVKRVQLNAAGDSVTDVSSPLSQSGALGITAQGDSEVFPGTVWTANHGNGDVTVFEPNDFGDGGGETCSGDYDATLDEDGDGYDNADEIDAGSDPCSAASTPPDFDDDGTSNLNDPDDDNDGIDDTADLFAVDSTNGLDNDLPATYNFAPNAVPGTILDLGFTGVMMNGSDYQGLYDPDEAISGGAANVLTVENVGQGDAHQTTNTQRHGYQVGVNATEAFTVETTVNGLPSDAESFQSQGVFVGTGDQDNYVKLTASAFSTGGGSGVQFAQEEGGAFTEVANPQAPTAGNTTTLWMTVYPSNGTVEAYYAVDGGDQQFVDETTVPTSWFDSSDGNATAVGVISTSNGASTTFDSTWQYLYVQPLSEPANQPPMADAGADQSVDEGATVQLDASGSSDPDGDALSYEWTQTAGPSVTLNDSTAASPTFTAPEVDADQTLTFEVNVSDGDATDTDTVNVTVQDTDVAAGDVVFAVNSGGSEYTATDGTLYAADTNFDGGSTYSVTQAINGTDEDSLYQTERYGDFWYNTSVENGTYEVTLQFAEIYHGVAGSDDNTDQDQTGDRLFDTAIEGDQVLSEYDIYAEAGGSLTAVQETFVVDVTDGELNIEFSTIEDNAKVSAITVSAAETNSAPTVDPIPNQTVTEGDSTMVDVTASDPDGDSLSLTLAGAPSFVSLSDAGDGNGTLTIAPQSGDAGTYQFDVVADDGQATANETVNLTVDEATASYGVETGTTANVQINTSTLTNASATMNGTLTLGDKSEATPYVKIWPEEQPEDAFWYTGDAMTGSGEFDFDVVLSPSTTYVWTAYSQSGDGVWTAGAEKTFTTPTGQFFGVTTNPGSDVGVEWVTLEGELVNLGDNDNATVYFTYWKQGQKSSTLTWWTGPVQSSTGPFSTQVQLDSNTTYEYRAFGQSDEGEWKAGPVTTFTTQDGQPYGVETDPASDVGAESATLNGNLTGLGDYDDATVYFQYWVPGQKDETLSWWTGSAQSSPGPFSADVAGLNTNTTYEVQAYAQSDEGKWTAGTVQAFTTGDAETNQPPTADAGADLTADEGSTVQLNASDSSDPDGDALDYTWTQTAGPSVMLNDAGTATPSFTAPDVDSNETLTFEVNVSDGDATDADTVNVTVQDTDVPGSAELLITPDSGTEASTYTGGAFQFTNTGDQTVTALTIDLSSTALPDMVFDPDGTAGDQAGKGLVIDSESGDGVGVVSAADGDVFGQPHNGVNGSDGYDVLTIQFTDFDPGETVTFSADNDPTSIKNATVSSQEAGPVSGLELSRATVTVEYETTTQTTQAFGDGSAGGAEAIAGGSVPPAPGIDAQGVTLDAGVLTDNHSAATVTDANQTLTVSGPAGADVVVLQVEGELELNNVPDYDGTPGYDIEEYEANKAENVQYYSATVGSDGTVDVPVTLTNSTDVGGFNYFTATVEGAAGPGAVSDVAVLQYAPGSDSGPTDQPVYAVNAGGGAYTAVDGTEYAADAYFDQFEGTTSTSDPIGNTDDDTLYQTERWGDPLSYSFPVENGTYDVTLQFAELYHGVDGGNPGGGVGSRVFNVSVEGTQVLTGYDIYEEVGPLNATDETFTVEVTDGTLDVEMTATVDNAKVSAITVAESTASGAGSADIAVTESSGIDASTFSGESFEVTNTGDQQIDSVQFDVSESLVPDAVFDPNGTAGDASAKELSIDSESGDGVGVVSTDSADVFSQPHNGVDDAEGYDVMTVEFDDFDPGESVSFSIDLDPTTIKGASTTGGAGSVSGLEIAGSEVTVGYADDSTQSPDLFGDGSAGGAQAAATGDVATAPTLGVADVALQSTDFPAHEAATVGAASQNLTLSGPAGASVEVIHVEASDPPSDGYDLDDYEADDAQLVTYQTVTLDASGEATLPVTLSESNLNYFVAAVDDGDTGQTSNTVVLDYNSSAGQAQVLHRVNAGESTTLSALDDGPDWTGVADTSSQYLVSVAPMDAGNYCGGTITSTTSAVPSSTPDAVYDCERYGNSTWAFDVSSGTDVEVRLYVGNQFDGASEPGDRQYNVSIEGDQMLTQYDPVADVGHANGTVKTFTVSEDGDGTVTVSFEQGSTENPQVNAIEVVDASDD